MLNPNRHSLQKDEIKFLAQKCARALWQRLAVGFGTHSHTHTTPTKQEGSLDASIWG